jgi:hypothetical protein
MSAPDIRMPGDVTADWLSAVLAQGGVDAQVSRFTAKAVGAGMIGDSVRFTLDYARAGADAPRSIVGKFPSAGEESRNAGVSLGNYMREVRFYQHLAKTALIRTPFCYFTDVDPVSHDFVLMMEDLNPARQGDQLAGASIADARSVVEEAAKLHASHWQDDAMFAFDWLNATAGDGPSFDVNEISALWDGFRARYGERVTPEAAKIGDALCANWLKYDHVDGPRGLNHADFRPDNMMFKDSAEGPQMVMLDWQSVGYGNPATDVAYFLAGAITPDERKEHGAALLAHYHATMGRHGVTYDPAHFERHFARGSFQLFLTAFFAAMLVTQTPRGDDMFFRMANGAVDQILDTGAMALLD